MNQSMVELAPGLPVSRLGFGCMAVSHVYGETDPDEALRTLHHAVDEGITFLDTADVYGRPREGVEGPAGTNEELVARLLADRRDEVQIATKFGITGLRTGPGGGAVTRGDRTLSFAPRDWISTAANGPDRPSPVRWPLRAPGRIRAMEYFEIASEAESSADFRRVLWTGEHTQLVVMTIPPGGEIGLETHADNDQILHFLSGTGEAFVGGETRPVVHGDLVIVPAGTEHNFTNTGPNPLVLTTVYGPPDHADGVVHHTKEEADAAEAAGLDESPSAG